MRRRNLRAAVTLGSVLESSEDIAQPETFAHAKLDGHDIARVTEDSRIQSFDAPIVVVATLPVAAADDERCLECLRVTRHMCCCDRASGSVLVRFAVSTIAKWCGGFNHCGRTSRVSGCDRNDSAAGGDWT
jgi:hypothetical protein